MPHELVSKYANLFADITYSIGAAAIGFVQFTVIYFVIASLLA
jgi:hypothetical protein